MKLFHKDIRDLGQKSTENAWILLSLVKSDEFTMIRMLQITLPFTKMKTEKLVKYPLIGKSKWLPTQCKQKINIIIGKPRWECKLEFNKKWNT